MGAFEMMAAGGISIVRRDESNHTFLKDEENCIMYEPGNINAATVAIRNVVEDVELRKKLIKVGIETAKKLDWKEVDNVIKSIYKR
jgi:glycosyltransferase involved in cell wall biosynthesis